MWVRRAFYRWLFPAAFVLPLWLLIGWGVFQASGWAFLWVLFIAIPSVFLGQLLLTLLVRLRPSVQRRRAVSWADAIGFTLWHGATIAVGFYPQQGFVPLVLLAAAIGIGMFVLMVNQLWGEARSEGVMTATVWNGAGGAGFGPGRTAPAQDRVVRDAAGEHDVIVIREDPRED